MLRNILRGKVRVTLPTFNFLLPFVPRALPVSLARGRRLFMRVLRLKVILSSPLLPIVILSLVTLRPLRT